MIEHTWDIWLQIRLTRMSEQELLEWFETNVVVLEDGQKIVKEMVQ